MCRRDNNYFIHNILSLHIYAHSTLVGYKMCTILYCCSIRSEMWLDWTLLYVPLFRSRFKVRELVTVAYQLKYLLLPGGPWNIMDGSQA